MARPRITRETARGSSALDEQGVRVWEEQTGLRYVHVAQEPQRPNRRTRRNRRKRDCG